MKMILKKNSSILNFSRISIILLVLIFCVFSFISKAALGSYPQTITEDFGISIINKAIPVVGTTTKDPGTDFASGYVSEFIDNLNLGNPTTLLSMQFPLLKLFSGPVSAFTGSTTGTISNIKVTEAPPTPSPTAMPTTAVPSAAENIDSDSLLKSILAEKPLTDPKIDKDKASVILFHTHATESYTPTALYTYNSTGVFRTDDIRFSVCRIGDEIKKYIENYHGYSVVHDQTLHDFPNFNGCYNRSKVTMKNLLKKYPDAKFMIDIHRDSFADSESAKPKLTLDYKGVKFAKIMFVVGKSNPHWQENNLLASKLNQKIEELVPGISRGVSIKDKSLYNQDVSNKSLLIEVGADCNTMEESLASAKVIAKAIGLLMKGQ